MKVELDVILTDAGADNNKMNVIKKARTITGLSLGFIEAKALIDDCVTSPSFSDKAALNT